MTVATDTRVWIVENLRTPRAIIGVWATPEAATEDNPDFEWGTPYKDGSRLSTSMLFIISPYVVN